MTSNRPRQLRRRRSRCALAVACMLPLEPRRLLASAFIDPPALPQVFLDTTYVPGTGTTHVANNAAELTTKLTQANLGDTIVLQAGTTYSGNFTLPNKTSGSGWITIRSS